MVHSISVSEFMYCMFNQVQIMFCNICVLTSAPSMYRVCKSRGAKATVIVYTDIVCEMYCTLLLHVSSVVGCSQGSVC